MKSLPVDTAALRFLVAAHPEPVLDFATKAPRADRDGQPLHQLDLLVSGEGRRGEVIRVKVAGTAPAVAEGQRVTVSGLVALPWSQDGRSGIAFTATRIETLAGSSKAA